MNNLIEINKQISNSDFSKHKMKDIRLIKKGN